jgi:hypothetical protein
MHTWTIPRFLRGLQVNLEQGWQFQNCACHAAQALVHAPNAQAERHAMADATRYGVIQVKKLNFPDWKKK